MKKQVVMKFAFTGVLMSAAVIGCTPGSQSYRPGSASSLARTGGEAAKLNRQAQEAIAKGQLDAAIGLAEQAVARSPRDAGYRMLLAELYLKRGRFQSAEATFADVVALYPENRRAALNLALTRIGLGKIDGALSTLGAIEQDAAASDVGLAYALAGESQRAIALLEAAARDINADGRVRQNLALAYALAGDWQKARVTAAQDLTPAELDARIQQWMVFAKPTSQWDQVAHLLGVTPAEDAGRPVHLALAPSGQEPVAYAEAAPAEVAAPAYVEAAPAAAPIAAETPVVTASLETAPEQSEVAPEVEQFVSSIDGAAPPPVRSVEMPSEQQAEYAVAAEALFNARVNAERARASAAPIAAFEAPKPRARRHGIGSYVVQLGAYRSPRQVEQGWAQLYRRYGLSRYSDPLSTTIDLPGRGTFHRLSVAGFDNHASANSVCRQIKAKGGACFVRAVAGDRVVQWASRYRDSSNG